MYSSLDIGKIPSRLCYVWNELHIPYNIPNWRNFVYEHMSMYISIPQTWQMLLCRSTFFLSEREKFLGRLRGSRSCTIHGPSRVIYSLRCHYINEKVIWGKNSLISAIWVDMKRRRQETGGTCVMAWRRTGNDFSRHRLLYIANGTPRQSRNEIWIHAHLMIFPVPQILVNPPFI